MRLNMKKHFLTLIGGLLLVIITACSSPSENFRSRYDSEYRIKDRGELNTIVSGIACARTVKDAVQSAKSIAHYNLRSVIGNQRFLVRYREAQRYNQDNQVCIEMVAIAQEP